MKNSWGELDKFKSTKIGSKGGEGIYSDEARPNLEALEKQADKYVWEAINKIAMTDSTADFSLDTPDNIKHLRLTIFEELEAKHHLKGPLTDPGNILKKNEKREAHNELLYTYYPERIDRILRAYIEKVKNSGLDPRYY